ncbi:MAG: hypothetical protein IPO78_17515 [Saprospiraceae bacterium]|nr:hypothetical protein [Saprospiraceae bacterium]
MAITIVSNPKKYSPAHWSAKWQFSMDDLGILPERKDFGYYLAEEGGTRLMEDKAIKPFAVGDTFEKEFQDLTKGLVYTSFPAELATAQTDSNYVKRVKLMYGEILQTLEGEDCGGVKSITSETGVINLCNANVNSQTHTIWGNSSGFIAPRTGLMLHERPTRWNLLHGAKDYVWFLGVGQIVLSYWNGAAQLGTNQIFSLTGANTAKYVCLDYSLYGISTPPTHMNLFYSDGVVETTISADYCSCQEQNKYLGILFLEPRGGRSMMCTRKPLTIDIERKGTEVYKPFDNSQTQHKTGGRSIIIPRGTRKLSFETEFDFSDGVQTWLENFCVSPGYHAQRGYGASTVWEKFILDPATIKIYEQNKLLKFNFQGYISESINGQTEDI